MSNTVQMITEPQKKSLMDAMTAAVQDTNGGMDANEAIAKRACEHGLSPEFACRMVEAYNSSKTVRYLQDTTGEKRADTFPLADKEEVLRLMYTPVQKAASYTRVIPSNFVDFTKMQPDRAEGMQKAAEVIKESVKTEEAPRSREKVANEMSGLCQRIEQARRELTMEAKHARERTQAAVYKVASAFNRSDADDFQHVDGVVWHDFGDLAKRAMDLVWATADFTSRGEKRAEAPVYGTVRVRDLYDGVREIMDGLNKSAECVVELHAFEKKASVIEDLVGKRYPVFVKRAGRPPQPKPSPYAEQVAKGIRTELDQRYPTSDPSNQAIRAAYQNVLADQALRQALPNDQVQQERNLEELRQMSAVRPAIVEAQRAVAEAQNQQATQDQAAAQGVLNTVMNPSGLAPEWMFDIVGGDAPAQEDVVDPMQDAELRKMKLQLIVNDMLTNDATLSAYPPDDVIDAVNQVSEVAPAAVTNPLLLRSMVARIVQQRGHLDPSEVKQLVETEAATRQTARKGA